MKMARSGSGKSICLGHGKTGTSPPYFMSVHSDTHGNVCSQSLRAAGGDGYAGLQFTKQKVPRSRTSEEKGRGGRSFIF